MSAVSFLQGASTLTGKRSLVLCADVAYLTEWIGRPRWILPSIFSVFYSKTKKVMPLISHSPSLLCSLPCLCSVQSTGAICSSREHPWNTLFLTRSNSLLNMWLMLFVEVNMIISRCEIVFLTHWSARMAGYLACLIEYGDFLCLWLLKVFRVESFPQLFADLIRLFPVKKYEGQHMLRRICHLWWLNTQRQIFKNQWCSLKGSVLFQFCVGLENKRLYCRSL